MGLPAELAAIAEEIKGHAAGAGLDFFDTFFEFCDYKQMNLLAAYGGFPNRYPHWRFGMEYEYLSKSYRYGLSRIYEMVINNDPCYAYLLASNNLVDQKIVMAHVYAHCDFFKNNMWFSKTNRKMVDEMANHATRVRRYMEKHGVERVEDFIDICLSLENLIDIHSQFITRKPTARPRPKDEDEVPEPKVRKLRSRREYMEHYINPDEYIERQLEEFEEEKSREITFPEQPERDVMVFIAEHAPLRNWERDVLSMIREEAYYFAPQAMTKIMNEGWASFWHSRIMTTKVLKDADVVDYADHHSGTLAMRPGRLNPYKIGIELFRDVEDRWNKGKFGREYEECESLADRKRWNMNLGAGIEKIFEVRRFHNDVTFIDEFLTEDFCREQKLFVFAYDDEQNNWVIKSRMFKEIKKKLLFQLTNIGHPIISVVDANHDNRGELMLRHQYDGAELQHNYAQDTLAALHKLWKKPVNIETVADDKPVFLSFDGEKHATKS